MLQFSWEETEPWPLLTTTMSKYLTVTKFHNDTKMQKCEQDQEQEQVFKSKRDVE